VVNQEEQQVRALLSRVFDLQRDPANPDPDFERFRRALAQQIARLMAEDPGYLMQLLYRVDVDERIAQRALDGGRAEALAGAVIARVLEKALSRRDLRLDDDPEPGDEGAL
jgi:hypothetical protein